MSTTTTIYTSKDTWLDGDNPTTNYGTSTTLTIGQQTVGASASERANAVLAFDVSTLTPSTLTQVNLKLTNSGSVGTALRTVNVYRLNQDFTEAEADWEDSADGTNWSGGTTVGGANNTALTESTATFVVGFKVRADTSVDITDMVKDAINSRSGTLLLWIGIPLSDGVTTRGNTNYYSLEYGIATDRPQLECITADRIVWDGSAGDGNPATGINWVGGVNPDSYDHAIFNDGSANVFYEYGVISCNSLFINKGYTGTIQKENGDQYPVASLSTIGHPTSNKICIDKSEGRFNLKILTSNLWAINITSTPTEGGRLYSSFTDKYSTTVIGASNTLEFDGDFNIVATGDKTGTKNITTSGTATSIKALNTKLTVTNGCNDFVLCGGSRMNATSGNIAQSGTSYITDNAFVKFLGEETSADINIFNGTLSFKDNENASITTEDIYLWKNGYFDPRTSVGAWDNTASPSIYCRGGGKFVVDTGRTITVL